jgi:hypothetical protein
MTVTRVRVVEDDAMPKAAHALARTLITLHGSDALSIAERAAGNVRQLGMFDKATEWDGVIDIIAAMQAARSEG